MAGGSEPSSWGGPLDLEGQHAGRENTSTGGIALTRTRLFHLTTLKTALCTQLFPGIFGGLFWVPLGENTGVGVGLRPARRAPSPLLKAYPVCPLSRV